MSHLVQRSPNFAPSPLRGRELDDKSTTIAPDRTEHNDVNRNPAGTPSGPETPRRRATLREVSKLAGVSLKTASRVMNGEPDVGATLTAKVREAAA